MPVTSCRHHTSVVRLKNKTQEDQIPAEVPTASSSSWVWAFAHFSKKIVFVGVLPLLCSRAAWRLTSCSSFLFSGCMCLSVLYVHPSLPPASKGPAPSDSSCCLSSAMAELKHFGQPVAAHEGACGTLSCASLSWGSPHAGDPERGEEESSAAQNMTDETQPGVGVPPPFTLQSYGMTACS